MKPQHTLRLLPIILLPALLGPATPHSGFGQEGREGVRKAYFRAIADHFQVPEEEVGIIGEWDLSPDEVPVVLFLSDRAGVSPDALIGFRRAGRPWREVAGRFGLHPMAFHLSIPGGQPLGPLERAYGEFRNRPSREWARVILEDSEIVALVNLRVLSEQTGVPPHQVLARMMEAGSFMACYPLLLGG